MTELAFLGLSKSQWDFINSFSNWFAAAGTIGAVWVSLRLARRSSEQRAKVSVGLYLLVTAGSEESPQEFVQFSITNTGDRPLQVVQIGWKVGFFKKRYCVQLYERSLSNQLPVALAHGQEARWMVPTSASDEPWFRYFARDFLRSTKCWPPAAITLRAIIHTTLGNTFVAKPSLDLLAELKKASKE